jgi:small-conductance mechanosensitive channel
MPELITEFMTRLDGSTPLVRVPFVIVLFLLFLVIYKTIRKITRRIAVKISREKRYALQIQSQEIVSAKEMNKFIVWFVHAFGLLVAFLIGISFLNVALGLFEQSRPMAGGLLTLILDSVGYVFQRIIDYIPSLMVIVVVLLIVRFLLHVVNIVFKGVAAGQISIPGFYSEWANTSFNLVRLLIYALTLIIIFPYLPGSDSPAFQGLSIFIGLLLSLGSTTAVANVVAGIVLTYTRAFAVGDRVSIHDTTGIVVERSSFVTRLETTKHEIISIPNSMVLSGHIINYSDQARAAGLFLYTSVTIGYDVPWTKVHELLISAALKTENIEKEPAPFVLQESLDDYSVKYQLNAATKDAIKMPRTHSDMNAHILDAFNAEGLEIMSPMFMATRDGSKLTLPD